MAQSRKFGKKLRRRQEQHAALLERIERSALKLERRKERLRTLEADIAELEHGFAEPRTRRSNVDEVAPGPRTARLIFNPKSGRDKEHNAERLAQIVRSLRAHGIEAEIGLRTSGKAARALARQAVEDGCPLVIVAGGDGTISDVASQLVGRRVPLGILPIGTMNNVARSLGVPLEIDRACALIAMGTTRHVDVGRVHTNSDPEDEYFLECAGVGLAAIGTLAGQAYEKRRWRVLPRALRRFFDSRRGAVRIELDDRTIEASTRIVTVSNTPLMGNNMLTAPQARVDDGLLDVAVYDGMTDAALVDHFMAAAKQEPQPIESHRTRRVRILTDERVLAHADMHVTSEAAMVDIAVEPGALTMIVGNGIGLTFPVAAAPEVQPFEQDEAAANGELQAGTPPSPRRS
jgi:YegS/Rv2252/BmrU family lipid kinase